MTLREKIEIKWIEYTIHPFVKDPVIPFNESMKNARRILILFPIDYPVFNEKRDLKQFVALFSQKEIIGIFFGKESPGWKSPDKITPVFLELDKLSLWNYKKCDSLKKIVHKSFDLLIDLTSSPNTLGPYLCRITKAPLRICMGGGDLKPFYNLEYNGNDWNSLSKFLKNLSG